VFFFDIAFSSLTLNNLNSASIYADTQGSIFYFDILDVFIDSCQFKDILAPLAKSSGVYILGATIRVIDTIFSNIT
jgi:hypothetical protein